MSDKIYSGLRIIFLVMAIIISLYYFKLPFALLSSILFIVYIYTQKVLKELDNKGLISLLGVVHPVFLQYVKTNILLSYNYPIIIKFANSTLSLLKIHYVVTKEEVDTVLVYLFLLGVVEIVSRIDTTATGRIAERRTVFRAKEFVEENDEFCKKYSKRIEKLYADINWSEFNCVPIEAETTIERGHRIKHYNNLLKCLRKNRGMTSPKLIVLVKRLKYSWIGNRYGIKQLVRWLEDKLTHNNIYLISGDPGSGKSMALLKLCIDLLKESYITGKTPVYINLKQWRSETGEWSKNNRPTEKELISFIKSQLYEDGDLATDSFLDQYFELMLKHGRFYFIFDSFDEMPCFIDSNDNVFLRDCISGLLYSFLTGPNQNGGVIASRQNNSPTKKLKQTYTVRLRKFSNKRIRKMIKINMTSQSNGIIKELFKYRMNVVESCRNPLCLSLLIHYMNEYHNSLPGSQYELFKKYVDYLLENRENAEKLSNQDIYNAAVDLSIMLQSGNEICLENPILEVKEYDSFNEKKRLEKYIYVLESIGLCRHGGQRRTVSFAHRRFQEFFYVEAIETNKVLVTEKDYDSIQKNNELRDVLALYCQVGKEDQVSKIKEYCCNEIKNNISEIHGGLSDGCVRFINSLRFLTEGFSNRKEILGDSISTINELKQYIKKDTSFIVLATIVDSLSLLDFNDLQQAVLDVFKLHNRWLNASIIRKCQGIQELSYESKYRFCLFFEESSLFSLCRDYFEIDFSLSLSDSFNYIRVVHRLLPLSFLIEYICDFLILSQLVIIFRVISRLLYWGTRVVFVSITAISTFFSDNGIKLSDALCEKDLSENAINLSSLKDGISRLIMLAMKMESTISEIRESYSVQPMSVFRIVMLILIVICGILLWLFLAQYAFVIIYSYLVYGYSFSDSTNNDINDEGNEKKVDIRLNIKDILSFYKSLLSDRMKMFKTPTYRKFDEGIGFIGALWFRYFLPICYYEYMRVFCPDGILLNVTFVSLLFLTSYYLCRFINEEFLFSKIYNFFIKEKSENPDVENQSKANANEEEQVKKTNNNVGKNEVDKDKTTKPKEGRWSNIIKKRGVIFQSLLAVMISFIFYILTILVKDVLITVVITVIPAILLCVFKGKGFTFFNLLLSILEVLIAEMLLDFLIRLFARLIYIATDCYNALGINNIKNIDRDVLVTNIKKYHLLYFSRMYVKRLAEADVVLCGEWPERYETIINDDVIIREIAIWECKQFPINEFYSDMI